MAYALGIATAGNRHVRALASEMAWGWRRFQPQSALAQGYQQRLGQGGSRRRRMGIVALARKLCSALWRFVETGVLPEGAALQAVVRISKRPRADGDLGLGGAAREGVGGRTATRYGEGASDDRACQAPQAPTG